jgi:hypothetical protein
MKERSLFCIDLEKKSIGDRKKLPFCVGHPLSIVAYNRNRKRNCSFSKVISRKTPKNKGKNHETYKSDRANSKSDNSAYGNPKLNLRGYCE